ncbi:MAG: GTP-binding protein [Nitrososphaerota archaeon]|nr:GTP-binding protein [Nitrososphaerota archaeon]MDG6939045.1 GTP-binding protein [Nitrososphaerota archaeon]
MGIPERIKQIEDDLHRTQVNKKTEHHIGLLRAKLAKLKKEQEEFQSRRGGSAPGFDVKKSGDATVVLIGLPSVGKSTLLNRLTNARSKVAAYQFTTLDVVPGVMEHKGARVQVLDLPGIIEGASSGRGLGKRVLSVARTADLVLFVVDVFQQRARELLARELATIGIKTDQRPPAVRIEKSSSGGIIVVPLVKLTRIREQLIKDVLKVYDIVSARVVVREDITDEQLVDVLLGNRVYLPSLTVMNKIDLLDPADLPALGTGFVPVSAESGLNIAQLKEQIYDRLGFIRIYMRRRDGETDFEEPMIVRTGSSVVTVCDKVHRKIKDEFRYAQVWGRSVKFGGQKVGLSHRLMDEDVITLVTR